MSIVLTSLCGSKTYALTFDDWYLHVDCIVWHTLYQVSCHGRRQNYWRQAVRIVVPSSLIHFSAFSIQPIDLTVLCTLPRFSNQASFLMPTLWLCPNWDWHDPIPRYFKMLPSKMFSFGWFWRQHPMYTSPGRLSNNTLRLSKNSPNSGINCGQRSPLGITFSRRISNNFEKW